jgi:uncharacterized protein (DUF2062 family)
MKGLLNRRLVAPILALLTQGLSPRMLALSLAVGLILGIFPVLGTTTVLCGIAALALRLNAIAVQAVQFAMTPVQLVTIIPFVRVGERVLGSPPQPLSIEAGLDLIAQGALNAVVVLRDAIGHAVLGWLLVGPVLLAASYLVLSRLLASTQRRLASTTPGRT